MYLRVGYFLIVNCLHKVLPAALLTSGKDGSSARGSGRNSSVHTVDLDLLDGPGYQVEEPMQEAIEGNKPCFYKYEHDNSCDPFSLCGKSA